MRALFGLAMACWLIFSPAAAGQQTHGFAFEDAVNLAEGAQLPLRALEETLRRHRPWQVVALYARSGVEHQEEMLQGLQPFVIEIVWLQQQPAEQVSEWWQDAFALAQPETAQRALLGPRMARVERIYAAGVEHGQRTRISYMPDAGLRIRHNHAEPVAVIGLDMAKLMIRIWPELLRPASPTED